MEKLLEYILKKLSSNPKDIKVEKEDTDIGITFHIEANEEDKGKIIGRGGSTIKAIRNIISIIAKQDNQKVFLKLD